jgi:hypothetical protein
MINGMIIQSRLVIGIIVIVILSIFNQSFTYGVSPKPETFSKESAPYGLPYTEWIIRWWQWHISLHREGHPYITHNIQNCPVGISGPVAFITHSIQGESHYTCTIPAGHAVLLRIASAECSSIEIHSESPPALIKCATEGQQYLTFEVTVDGVPLKGLEQNVALSRFFNITIPADNVYDIKAGTYKAVAHGYFAFLKPLPPGEHNVDIAARVVNPIDPSFNFNYHTTFVLKVQ